MNKWGALILLGSMAACSSLSKKDCESMDWGTRGLESAKRGERLGESLNKLKASCDEYGVPAKADLYEGGYKQGIAELCTPQGAMHFGLEGGAYRDTCPKELEEGFLKPIAWLWPNTRRMRSNRCERR